jgi:hypothetical protein
MKQFDQIVLRLRMQPFKTSFTPNFKINWGDQKFPKMGYVEREKRPVQVFDVREFVKEKRQQKIREMMMDNGPGAPVGGGSGLMSAPTPFTPPVTPMSQPTSQPQSSGASQSVDIDDLVRKIDAKIAEIEKEEKEKNAQAASAAKPEEREVKPEPKAVPPVKNESIISTESIENKVNDIIRENYPSNPLENVDKKMDKIEEKTRETIMPTSKPAAPSTVSSAPEKPTISLDDIDENQFFDDFFEE